MKLIAVVAVASMLLANAPVPSSLDLGQAEGRCRPGEAGPAFLVDVVGLKDRRGLLKLEVYPSNDDDFLQDDNILINAGRVFRRFEIAVPATPQVSLCIRVPAAEAYSVSLLHDRDSDHKFSWSRDGVGFAGNPRLGWSKPKAAAARTIVGNGPTRITIIMNYRRGLGMSPLPRGTSR